jgi:nucleotide-binding universal stress UspA family protein
MPDMKKILACIDDSLYADSVSDHTAWAAARLAAAIELLHVIQRNDAVAARHDLSGAVGLGAKSALLEELVSIDEAEARLARERGRLLLQAAEERIRAKGLTRIATLQRHGGIVETVIERESDADIIVIGKRGASANFAKGHLGSKVERVARESMRPVLVASRAFTEPKKALVAFDGGPSARKAVEFMAASPLAKGLECHVVMASTAESTSQVDLSWAAERLPSAVIRRISGAKEEIIRRYVSEQDIGLLVMGAYGHSPLRSLILGSTTTVMMRSCLIPVLLFR